MNSKLAEVTRLTDLPLEYSDGRTVVFADLLARCQVILYFMRASTCAVCLSHVQSLTAKSAEIQRLGAQVILATRLKLPFPVVADVAKGAYQAVGLRQALFGAIQQSGTVLIDQSGVVRFIKYATVPLQAYDEAALLAALHSLN